MCANLIAIYLFMRTRAKLVFVEFFSLSIDLFSKYKSRSCWYDNATTTSLSNARLRYSQRMRLTRVPVRRWITLIIIIIVNNYGVRLYLTCKSHAATAITSFGLRPENRFMIRSMWVRMILHYNYIIYLYRSIEVNHNRDIQNQSVT